CFSIHVNNLVIRLRKWDHNVPTKTDIYRKPTTDFDLVLRIGGVLFVSQVVQGGKLSYVSIGQAQKKTCKGAAVAAEIWVARIWNRCCSLTETICATTKLARNNILELFSKLHAKVKRVAPCCPQPVVDRHDP